MNKQQAVWLIIRLIGLYFAYLAIVSLFALIGAIPALFTLPKIDADGRPNANASSTPSPVIRVQPIPPDGSLDAADPTAATEKANGETLTEKFTAESVKTAAWFFLSTLLYGAVAWYLLRDGRVLFEVLGREDPHGLIKEREAEVTTLNLSDKQS